MIKTKTTSTAKALGPILCCFSQQKRQSGLNHTTVGLLIVTVMPPIKAHAGFDTVTKAGRGLEAAEAMCPNTQAYSQRRQQLSDLR